jgi:acyl-CoA hydrolase
MQIEMQKYTLYHLIKGEDLNHHGTLYAGRSAEWFVEAGFVAAANLTRPENIVCLKIHGMTFERPVHKGDVIHYESRVVLTGRSRIITHISMCVRQDRVVDGFITFVNVDAEGHAMAHDVEIVAKTDEEKEIQTRAANLG